MLPVKVCGITNLADAQSCIEYGAAALGFVMAPSKRRVSPEQVRQISSQLPPWILRVGVFVDEDPLLIKEILNEARLDLAQLHGNEPPEVVELLEGRVIKVFRSDGPRPDPAWRQVPLRGVLVDSGSGGTGQVFDWRLFKQFRSLGVPLILAGGLNNENIKEAVLTTSPDGVDVSSGVEVSPGIKDPQKVQHFMEQLKQAELLTKE